MGVFVCSQRHRQIRAMRSPLGKFGKRVDPCLLIQEPTRPAASGVNPRAYPLRGEAEPGSADVFS